MLMANVDSVFDLTVDRGHDISDLEADATDLDQIFLLKSVAGNVHFRAMSVSHNSPDLFFWLFLEHRINLIVNIILIKDPICAILVKQSSYYLVLHFLVHVFFSLFKVLCRQ